MEATNLRCDLVGLRVAKSLAAHFRQPVGRGDALDDGCGLRKIESGVIVRVGKAEQRQGSVVYYRVHSSGV